MPTLPSKKTHLRHQVYRAYATPIKIIEVQKAEILKCIDLSTEDELAEPFLKALAMVVGDVETMKSVGPTSLAYSIRSLMLAKQAHTKSLERISALDANAQFELMKDFNETELIKRGLYLHPVSKDGMSFGSEPLRDFGIVNDLFGFAFDSAIKRMSAKRESNGSGKKEKRAISKWKRNLVNKVVETFDCLSIARGREEKNHTRADFFLIVAKTFRIDCQLTRRYVEAFLLPNRISLVRMPTEDEAKKIINPLTRQPLLSELMGATIRPKKKGSKYPSIPDSQIVASP